MLQRIFLYQLISKGEEQGTKVIKIEYLRQLNSILEKNVYIEGVIENNRFIYIKPEISEVDVLAYIQIKKSNHGVI